MRAIFTMLRVLNLLIIALTFLFIRYLVFVPIYTEYSLLPGMGNTNYVLLIIATMLIASAGYIINDYFDVMTDSINKPQKLYIGKQIKPSSALATSLMMSSIALISAIWLTSALQSWLPLIILLIALIVAWWYAMVLKKSFLWGNIAVSCMSAGTIAMAWLIEKQCSVLPEAVSARVSGIIAAISVFAFMLSLLREIVKDMEDMEGDKLIHCRSLPILKGIPFTKNVLFILSAITFALLIIAQIYLFKFTKITALLWLLFTVEIPLGYFTLKLNKAESKANFHALSSMLKWIMVAGIASIVAGQF